MKLGKLALTVSTTAVVLSSLLNAPTVLAQVKEQFFPVLVYRTGAYAANGSQWANGYVDYLKLVNARGGINGVKISFEECETAYATDRGVECYERLKGKNGGATLFQPLSTGVTFALTEKAPVDKIPLITAGYGRSESQNGAVFTWNFPLLGTYWVGAEVAIRTARNRSRSCRNWARPMVSKCSCCRWHTPVSNRRPPGCRSGSKNRTTCCSGVGG